MNTRAFSAKPAVIRCSRCGRFVDWAAARVQVICDCRPHFDLPPVFVREISAGERDAALSLFERDFGGTRIMAFGEMMDLGAAPALVVEMNGEMAGALAYRTLDSVLQIIALATDPAWQRSGVGGYLLAEAELLARRLGLERLAVSTTNDNLPALYFYQRRGYRLSEAIPNGVAKHGSQHPGFAGIPVRDEIRLEKPLTRDSAAQ
jgi:GNAT superfamily N-acetyltransferase